MNALYLTVFASLLLAGLGLLLFFHSTSQRDRDHVERLALLPLDDHDDFPVPPAPEATQADPTPRAPRPDRADPRQGDALNPVNEGEPDVR